MNGKTGGTRSLRRAGAVTVIAAVAVLATACGSSSAPSFTTSVSAESATFAQLLALAQCMRGHGVPDFPDPGASGSFTLSSNGARGTVDIDSSQVQVAYGACRHLLPDGGPNPAQLQQQQQQAQRALPGLLKFSQCMRSHGVPNFPDPPASGQPPAAPKDAGINPKSPQFLAAARACQRVLPAGVHISLGVHKS